MIKLEGISKNTGVAIAVAAKVDAVNGINGVSPTLLMRGIDSIKKSLQPKDFPEAIIVCDNMAIGAAIKIPGINTIGIAVQGPDVPGLPVDVPCVYSLQNLFYSISDGDIVIVDGHRGEVHIDPDPQTLIHYQSIAEEVETRQKVFLSSEHIPVRIQSGETVYVYAHCFSEPDAQRALDEGADGLIMDLRGSDCGDCYSEVLRDAAGKRVVFAVDYASDELLIAAARFAAAHQVSILFPTASYDIQMAGINPIIEEIKAAAHANDLDPPDVEFGIIAHEYEFEVGIDVDEGCALAIDLRESAYPDAPEGSMEYEGPRWLAARQPHRTLVLLGERIDALTSVIEAGVRSIAVMPEAVGAAKTAVKLIGAEEDES